MTSRFYSGSIQSTVQSITKSAKIAVDILVSISSFPGSITIIWRRSKYILVSNIRPINNFELYAHRNKHTNIIDSLGINIMGS